MKYVQVKLTKKKIICFDVDGVLVDSYAETMVASWNEYNLWLCELGLPFSEPVNRLEDIPSRWLNIRQKFSLFVNKGYHRVAINPLILCNFNPECLNSKLIHELSEIESKMKEESLDRIKKVRKEISSSQYYPKLVGKFPNVDYNWIKQKHNQDELFFVTNNPYSIKAFSLIAFQPDVAKVRTINKGIHNKALHINLFENNIPSERILFVDDSSTSLQEVYVGTSLPKKNIIQNSWVSTKNQEGFPVLNFEEIVKTFEAI